MTDKKIPGTDEAWETGLLGNDAEFAIPLSAEQQTVADAAVADALGLRPISIRLEAALIDDFKHIATIHGLGYQTLMRQALKRFATCEMKRIVADTASQIRADARQAKRKKVA